MNSSSSTPVNTYWPFLPITVAVPVSWQKGKTPWAAISAFLSIVRATLLSLSEASGSSKMAATIFKWAGLNLNETSLNAFLAKKVKPFGSTFKI